MAIQQNQMSPAQAQASAAAAAYKSNQMARDLILSQATDTWLNIATNTVTGTIPGQTFNVPVRNVGFIKRFVIELSGTLAQTGTETLTRTTLGAANIISNVTFTDLANNARINSTGWHLHALASARRQGVFGGAFTNDSPTGYGANFKVIGAPSPITAGQVWRVFVEVPVTYGDYDLRGGIYANVVNGTMNLAFTINPNFVVANTANPTLAAYQSSSAVLGTHSAVSYTVWQNILDKLPEDKNGGAILPYVDMAQNYLISYSQISTLVLNQDNPSYYANFRQFLSTIALYDNVGVLGAGADVNSFSMQTANYTNIWKFDPYTAKLLERQIIGDDFPLGMYYFDHRKKPIATSQFGNMSLNFNPAAVTAGAVLYTAWEMMAATDQVTNAGSLYGQ
jgi:hypothetical protein